MLAPMSRIRAVAAFIAVAVTSVVGVGTISGWVYRYLTTPASNLYAEVEFGPYSLPPPVLKSGVVSPLDRLHGYWLSEVRNTGSWHVESVVLLLPSAVWASVERQGRPSEDQQVNGAVTIGIVSPGEKIRVVAWTESAPTNRVARDVRLRHLVGYGSVYVRGAGWRVLSGRTAIVALFFIIVVVALILGAATVGPHLVYFFKRLPTEETDLTVFAAKLGVSTAGTAVTFGGQTGTNLYELQRRIKEAIRQRRDSLAWVVALLAALASVASAVAAWFAASKAY